jgi:GrpB-like predicted nucleotidyltransferase (UPF0157 family)
MDYDPEWPLRYSEERERLLDVLGNTVRAMEHIGSTAIPGIPAKPVIDIAIIFDTLNDARSTIPAVELLGYTYVPEFEEVNSHRLFLWIGTPTVHTYHLHMTTSDSDDWIMTLRLRNYLRAHPDDAAAYGALKKQLAAELGSDMAQYVERKTAFVESVLRKAEREL